MEKSASAKIVADFNERGIFIGGPPSLFHVAGKKQLAILKHFGLTKSSKVLDIGCGCLRGGRWVIPELEKGHYFGIEPNKNMLQNGLDFCIDKTILLDKEPKFDNNHDFNFEIFKNKFDFFIARSIWSHASKSQIEKMLDQFISSKSESGIFLTSYHRTRIPFFREYHGKEWVGKSHSSNEGGVVRHSFGRIKRLCNARNLEVKEMIDNRFDFGTQRWLIIKINF